jgi:hypothetical protein
LLLLLFLPFSASETFEESKDERLGIRNHFHGSRLK